MEKSFEISEDIAHAETLPAEVYYDPGWYERARQRVFARSWQFIADAPQMKAPGHVRPFTLLEGCLDEPLVLTVDQQVQTHCLSNVCTHRGALVVEGEGHVRTFAAVITAGNLASMARSLRCRCSTTSPIFRPIVITCRWGPFQFCSLDPAFPFAELVAPMKERVGFLPLDRAEFDPGSSRDYHLKANWALYCDNYLEEFLGWVRHISRGRSAIRDATFLEVSSPGWQSSL